MRGIKILFLVFVLLSILSPAYCEDRFINRQNGTIEDTFNGLVWIKSPESVQNLQGTKIWVKSRDACRDLVYAGKGPNVWRLPTITELQSLLDESGRSPRIDSRYFDCSSELYWSSTDDTGTGCRVWTLNFANGELNSSAKLSLVSPVYLRTRCVRNIDPSDKKPVTT